jgi:hypothetical protein
MAMRTKYGWLSMTVVGVDPVTGGPLYAIRVRTMHPGWWAVLAWYWLWRPVDEALRGLRSSD